MGSERTWEVFLNSRHDPLVLSGMARASADAAEAELVQDLAHRALVISVPWTNGRIIGALYVWSDAARRSLTHVTLPVPLVEPRTPNVAENSP